jgi:cytochrome c biogenesis protein CcdA
LKNPVVFYAVIALGVIALIVGGIFLPGGHHPFRAYVGLGAGVVLIIAGIVGMFVLKPKANATATEAAK